MILALLMLGILGFTTLVFSIFPVVTELPFGIENSFATGVSAFRLLTEYIPPLGLMLDLALIYIGFRISLLLLRFFLGNRSPSHA